MHRQGVEIQGNKEGKKSGTLTEHKLEKIERGDPIHIEIPTVDSQCPFTCPWYPSINTPLNDSCNTYCDTIADPTALKFCKRRLQV